MSRNPWNDTRLENTIMEGSHGDPLTELAKMLLQCRQERRATRMALRNAQNDMEKGDKTIRNMALDIKRLKARVAELESLK